MTYVIVTFCLILLSASVQVLAQSDLYVSSASGSNRNDGSKASPFKNIQKAIDVAANGTTIHVAEGNYFGTLDVGVINVTKPVRIYGGYSADFSTRDVLKYLTLVQPTPASNGTNNGQGTMQIQVKTPNSEVVIDGLIFDRGNSNAYNSRGEGQPEGVESGMMQPIGMAGIGGEDLKTTGVLTKQTSTLYLDNISCDLTVRNCAFLNSPYYGMIGSMQGTKGIITNCVFVNNRYAAVEIRGSSAAKFAEVHFSYNTVLFSWSRLKDLDDMGYGYRYMPGVNSYVTNNIIGCSVLAGLDRGRVESDRKKEAARITTAENNIFFLNRGADLTLPGGGLFQMIKVEQFDDVEQLAKADGNKTLADPAVFKGIINEPYLNGFLNATSSETTNVDYNSFDNTFRQALGMNMTGTIQTSASMFANRYPWREALKFFGAIQGYGAQAIENGNQVKLNP